MEKTLLSPLFDPETVAVFGASQSSGGVGARVYANIIAAGFKGDVIPINPKYAEIDGTPCYPTLADAGRPASSNSAARLARGMRSSCRQASTMAAAREEPSPKSSNRLPRATACASLAPIASALSGPGSG